MSLIVELIEVTADNWRACADLDVSDEQRDFVSPVTRYLCLCHYGGVWRPLAVTHDGEVVGFAMWAVDPDDRSGWVGGLVIGLGHQRKGYGRAAVLALLERLRREQGCTSAALSYAAENAPARALYRSLGFAETGEREDDELVARLRFGG
jgi:diamine N-acetyltransferase